MRIRKALFPVAGLGTRFLPAVKAQPKEMLPVVDKPVVQLLVEEAVASGIEEIIFITGKNKRALEDHFDYAPELEAALRAKGKHDEVAKVRAISDAAKFSYVRQKEPRGDGDAILSAAHLIGDEPCAIMFGDDLVVSDIPCLRQLMDVYERYHAPVIAAWPVPKKDVSQYGIMAGKKVGERTTKITSFVEKPAPESTSSRLAVVGKYIITPEIVEILRQVKVKGEIRLANAFEAYVQKGGEAYAYEFEGTRFDCGSKLGLLEATVAHGLAHPETGAAFRSYLRKLDL